MKENPVAEAVDYWGEEARQSARELYPLTPEEEDALWEDPVYGMEEDDDEDWGSDRSHRTPSRGKDSYTLKYMDEEKTVSREEVVTLAQKGMDYDRVRRRLEETGSALKEYEELRGKLGLRGEQLRWMDELAREQGNLPLLNPGEKSGERELERRISDLYALFCEDFSAAKPGMEDSARISFKKK